MPGIGDIWSCIIAAEIGPFDRFPNADTLEFWAGLTADVKESAGRTQTGNITKAGSRTLRWALCNAALTLCHSDETQEAIRQRIMRKTGGIKGKANTAMGRRLLRLLYAMVRDNRPYQRGPQRDRTAAATRLALPNAPPRRERRPRDREVPGRTSGGSLAMFLSASDRAWGIPSSW